MSIDDSGPVVLGKNQVKNDSNLLKITTAAGVVAVAIAM
jgi:hypothetical protein